MILKSKVDIIPLSQKTLHPPIMTTCLAETQIKRSRKCRQNIAIHFSFANAVISFP